jgi:hypothetical protein
LVWAEVKDDVLDIGCDILLKEKFGRKIYMRKCYEELWVEMPTKSNVLITGTPGIGKTFFGLLTIRKQLLSSYDAQAIYQYKDTIFLLHRYNDILQVAVIVKTDATRMFGEQDPLPYYVDPGDCGVIMETAGKNGTYIFSSLKRVTSDLRKENMIKLYCPIPYYSELDDMRSTCYPAVTVEKMNKLVDAYGNIPRIVLGHADDDSNFANNQRTAIDSASTTEIMKIVDDLKNDRQLTGQSYYLVHVDSSDLKSQQLRYACEAVREKLAVQLNAVSFTETEVFLQANASDKAKGVERGYLLEPVVFTLLTNGTNVSVKVIVSREKEKVKVQRTGNSMAFSYRRRNFHALRTRTPTEIKAAFVVERAVLNTPVSKNLESGDCFALDAEGVLNIFQITTYQKHTIKINGLLQIIYSAFPEYYKYTAVEGTAKKKQHCRDNFSSSEFLAGTAQVRLFFVVPAAVFDAYEFVSYDNNNVSELQKVSQHVIRIPCATDQISSAAASSSSR